MAQNEIIIVFKKIFIYLAEQVLVAACSVISVVACGI